MQLLQLLCPQLKHGEIHSTVHAAAVLTGTQYALEVQMSAYTLLQLLVRQSSAVLHCVWWPSLACHEAVPLLQQPALHAAQCNSYEQGLPNMHAMKKQSGM